MALYEKVNEVDIIEPVIDLLGPEGGFRMHGDGKIRALLEPSIFHDGPWINVKVSPERNCFLWHHIYFKRYGIIPSKCFNCWKIVIKPDSLEDLMRLLRVELDMGLPSKCGIERRDYNTHSGWYAGFFYAPLSGELDDALNLCERVKEEVYKKLPKETPIFLKRACTEFENRFGPSNLWKWEEAQEGFEQMLDSVWAVPPLIYPEPSVLIPFMMKKWIRWGFSHRDLTSQKYYDRMENFGVHKTVRYDDGYVDIFSSPKILRGLENASGMESTKEENKTQLEGLPED